MPTFSGNPVLLWHNCGKMGITGCHSSLLWTFAIPKHGHEKKDRFVRRRCDGPPPPKQRNKSRLIGDLVRMRRCRVWVWIEQGSRNGRTTPTREGIVLCRRANHAERERVWGSCGERGHKLGSRWVDQPSQEVVPLLSIRIPPFPVFLSIHGVG